MSSFPEMEWNGKWDWENLMMFGSKVSESPKKLQLTDWGIEDGGELDAGSFNMSGGGLSGSDLGNGSSAKSSFSASTESSLEDGMKTSKFGFESLKGPLDEFTIKAEQRRTEISRTSPLPEASFGSVEKMIGLKLGKRTYFENSCSGGNAKSPSSVIPLPSTTTAKKTKSVSPGVTVPRCQVEGCNLDLSSAKDYHRKHRVCDSHSKSPKVVIGGLERRFCQQCSRFHNLSEFDEKKRSCRRRLSDHNARRRKPHHETIQFHSSRIPSSFYDGRQQMNFVLNDVSLDHRRNTANLDWDSTRNSKFTITTGFPLKPVKSEGMSGQPQTTGNNHQLLNAINMHGGTSNGFLALNGSSSPGFSQGFKDSVYSSSSVDAAAAPDFRRALSLLSNNSWGSYEPGGSISLPGNPIHVTHRSTLPQTAMHPPIPPQGLPLSSSDYWLTTPQSTYPHLGTLTSGSEENGHFEGNHVFKSSYEPAFYQSPLD